MYKKQPNSYQYGNPFKYPPYTVGALSGFGTPVDLGVNVQASPVDDKINDKDDADRNNKNHKIEQLRFNARSEFAHGATFLGCLLGGILFISLCFLNKNILIQHFCNIRHVGAVVNIE